MTCSKRPNFLYIGTSRAGSSWLFECLKEHPDIFVPIAKDIKFFERKFEKGIEWYLRFFNQVQQEKAIGELSHDYFLFPEVAKRIHQFNPEMKLICCMREPIDKMRSSYYYARSAYLDHCISFNEFAFDDTNEHCSMFNRIHNMGLKSADYYNNLKPFYAVFPKNQIKIVFYDDIQTNPTAFLSEIFTFLGVDPQFQPAFLNKKVYANRAARIPLMGHGLYAMGGVFRHLGLENIVGKVKRNVFFDKIFYDTSPKKKKNLAPEDEQQVYEYFSNQYFHLEELIEKKLPKTWWRG